MDEATIADFEARTIVSTPWAPGTFSYEIPVVVVTTQDRMKCDSAGRKLQAGVPERDLRAEYYWYGLIEKYPGAWGVTRLSDVGFNNQFTQALVYITRFCGGNCQHSETLVLQKA